MYNPFPDSMRLDRLLSHHTLVSRSRTKGLFKSHEILVNGSLAEGSGQTVSRDDIISIDGDNIEWPRHYYVMLYKPEGYACTTEEGLYPPVHELVTARWNTRLHSAGRLDVNTTGLVLLTDDGKWSHRVTSPKSACEKHYIATLADPVDEATIVAFASGILLKGDPRTTLPARIELIEPDVARVCLTEGRYHQVKRMFAACGNHVEALHRESIGPLPLDPALAPGDWRELTEAEAGVFG